ncbi:MAG: 3'-5' exonuclease [Puniceicoccaceae bacterium 5H]|nr:MAG: 3'-5' exonuclease [Puniceicoccaceae bacterium 5H]
MSKEVVVSEPAAIANQIARTISKEQINDLPLGRYEGPIRVISRDEDVAAAAETLAKQNLLGFDTESRPSFKRGQNFPPAVLQLGGPEEIYLFQLLQLTELKPVLKLLSNPSIKKVGVAIHDDVRKLREHYEFKPAGFVELADISQAAGIVNTGLRSLTALLLGFRISKGAQVSNWARPDLSENQLVYAATDAWTSRLLYLRMEALGWTQLSGKDDTLNEL